MTCYSGTPLFNWDENSTKEIIENLEYFRLSYEPYHGYLCTVICIFGIITNVINIMVLTKRQMRSSINVLLTGIAFCDMGTMASYLIYIMHFVLTTQKCNPNLYSYAWMLYLVCHIIISVALHTTGLWLAVAMAFVRHMTLKRAMTGSKWLSSKNTWKICLIVYLCVFTFCIPSVFCSRIVEFPNYFNDTCQDSKLALQYARDQKTYTITIPENYCFLFTLTLWLTGTLFKIIPCILLAVLITDLLWTIKKAERRRRALFETSTNRARARFLQAQSQAQAQMKSDRTTTMLLVILGLFLLTELPQGAVSILSGIYVEDMQMYVYKNIGDILDLLSLINSSVNFILYCAMSSKYRQVFWQVVLPPTIYANWFTGPSATNQTLFASRQPVLAQAPSHQRSVRADLQALANMANAVVVEQDDQETSVMELYRPTDEDEIGGNREGDAKESSVISRGIFGSFRRKKTSDSNLRRQALTRAALLAATPALTIPDSNAEIEPLQSSGDSEIQEQIQEDIQQDMKALNTVQSNQSKKHCWHISCSCLCKCACKGGGAVETEKSLLERKSGITNIEMMLVKKDTGNEDVHLKKPLYPSKPFWNRFTGSNREHRYAFL